MSYLRVRAVIFDVDGVLLDARASYHAAAEEAARRAVQEVLGRSDAPFDRVAEVPKFKAAGRFNDDWEMARGIAVLLHLRHTGKAPSLDDFLGRAQGRGVEGLAAAFLDVASHYPQAWLSRLCGALYGGRSRCRELFGFEAIEAIEDVPEEGFWERETKLVDPALLRRVTRDFPVGIYTGRNPGEAALALVRCELHVPRELCWVADGRPRKPDPTGLEFLCGKLVSKSGGSEALFVGDTADDEQAARAARARGAPLVYAHVAAPGDTTRVLERLLAETGA
ncbi:MAG: HAD family hydrolase [Deltaproteobacteria bacterium]|nr:MAG: HAD family hydrolase [Deltaproteobacteria bacterium]TMB36241.1 MAG: HAD family hydrolase [Deltaproteobacteria bacterium]